jgi:hypothetical protein
MTSSKRFLTQLVIVGVFIAAAPVGASAGSDGDKSFSSVVKHIKSNYRAKQQGFLGFVSFARFVVKVIRPAGVKNFKVTMLRDLDYSYAARPETPEFHTAIEDKIQTMWSPLIRFSSAREKQWAYIYVTQEKKDVKVLAVAVHEKQAFVFQMKFSPEKLSAFISDPKIMGISIGDEKRSGQAAPPLADPAAANPVPDKEEKSPESKPPASFR